MHIKSFQRQVEIIFCLVVYAQHLLAWGRDKDLALVVGLDIKTCGQNITQSYQIVMFFLTSYTHVITLMYRSQHGLTPLHQAAQQGHAAVINQLLQKGADPNETANVR